MYICVCVCVKVCNLKKMKGFQKLIEESFWSKMKTMAIMKITRKTEIAWVKEGA